MYRTIAERAKILSERAARSRAYRLLRSIKTKEKKTPSKPVETVEDELDILARSLGVYHHRSMDWPLGRRFLILAEAEAKARKIPDVRFVLAMLDGKLKPKGDFSWFPGMSRYYDGKCWLPSRKRQIVQ